MPTGTPQVKKHRHPSGPWPILGKTEGAPVEPSRIVVVGNANVDLTSYVERVPDEGETILSGDFTIGMGGKGANQAVACSRAGSPVAFIGAVGSDTFGSYMSEGLAAELLNLDHLGQHDTASGVASIMVDGSGANRIAVFVGASGRVTADDAIRAVDSLSDGKFLISQLEITPDVVSAALRRAKERQMTTVLNTAPYRPLGPEILAHTDWIIANEGEAAALLADAGIADGISETPSGIASEITSWSEALGLNLLITLGPAGAVGQARGEEPFLASAPPVRAVDTVGAGDCFVGYFVALLDQGFTWQQAMMGAVHAASWSVQHPGAQSSYPNRSTANDYAAIARETPSS